MNGPNLCDGSNPCVMDAATCSTGVAGGLTEPSHNYWCPFDLPVNSLPNGRVGAFPAAPGSCVMCLLSLRAGSALNCELCD